MSFLENFKAVYQHLDPETKSCIIFNNHQYNDAVKPFIGKDKAAALALGTNRREGMISCIYSLKDVCDQLFGVILKLTEKTKSVTNETPAKLEEVLVKSFKNFPKTSPFSLRIC